MDIVVHPAFSRDMIKKWCDAEDEAGVEVLTIITILCTGRCHVLHILATIAWRTMVPVLEGTDITTMATMATMAMTMEAMVLQMDSTAGKVSLQLNY